MSKYKDDDEDANDEGKGSYDAAVDGGEEN